jgi:hypothetical protein
MHSHFATVETQSRELVLASRELSVEPTSVTGLAVRRRDGEHFYAPTNWAFNQVAQLAEAPAGYLATLPAPIVADCVNYGLQFKRSIEDVKLLLQRNGESVLRAANGPNYGRVWNHEILDTLVKRFGNGRDGDWKVPGEFGRDVPVTKQNTTLFASDRDMFVFLADEKNRIELPGRRAGLMGTFARGFFVWNSEVGSKKLGLAMFLFDYACCNRIVWGAQGYSEISLRHTASAPERWLDELTPALASYADAATDPVTAIIKGAQQRRLDKVDEFLAGRFSPRMAGAMQAVHQLEEGRPVETVWDAVTAATAYARSIPYQDKRVELERKAGELLARAS